MKAPLFWLCLFIASLASIEGRGLKKPNPVKYTFKLANRIESRQRNEKWKKESSKEKNIRCFVVDNSRTVRCSLVKKCPSDDPTCRTFRQVRQTSESFRKDKVQKTSGTRKTLHSKCSDTKNPLCIHDIWVGGKRSYQNPVPKKQENILTTLCGPEDEMCLLTIKRARAEESSKVALKNDKDEVRIAPEEKTEVMNGKNPSSSISPSRPGCDFIGDPNCKLEDLPETSPVIEDVLKRLQASLPTIKRQKICKDKPDSKMCRWRPQPNDISENQRPLSSSISSTKDSESKTY